MGERTTPQDRLRSAGKIPLWRRVLLFLRCRPSLITSSLLVAVVPLLALFLATGEAGPPLEEAAEVLPEAELSAVADETPLPTAAAFELLAFSGEGSGEDAVADTDPSLTLAQRSAAQDGGLPPLSEGSGAHSFDRCTTGEGRLGTPSPSEEGEGGGEGCWPMQGLENPLTSVRSLALTLTLSQRERELLASPTVRPPSPTVAPTPRPSASASPQVASTPAPAVASRQPTSRGNRPPVVAIDPGHGGKDNGAERKLADGTLLQEKTLTLKVALEAARILREAGLTVVLTRDGDYAPSRGGVTGLQSRVDIANAAKADLLVSIHFNSAPNAQGGTETFYNPDRPFAARSYRLANLVQQGTLATLRSFGYQAPDRGVKADSKIAGGGSLYLLAKRPDILRPSEMPGVLGEALFITNPSEVVLAQRSDVLLALGRAYATAVMRYLAGGE